MLDWSTASVAPAEPTEICPVIEPPPPTLPPQADLTPEPERESASAWSDAIALRHPYLVQMLPWDFRTSFPQPVEETILNGTLQPEDAEPANLASLHEEHARHGLAILHDLDAVTDARRTGVDPRNGKAPRTHKQREVLEKLFNEEQPRLEREFDTLIDVYEEVFGEMAADAFRKAIRAWHAGVEVIGDAPSTPQALAESVAAGVFGVEEDGTNVHPSGDEVSAITEVISDALADEPCDRAREDLLKKYAEDFGQEAADGLDRWSRLRFEADGNSPAEYDPGHPWHYYHQGDGADPLPLEAIPARPVTTEQFSMKWPKNAAKRRNLMQQMLSSQREQLAEDENRYQRLIKEGVEALSQYDREIAHGGNDDLAWASAIALKYNHIGGARGRVTWLEKQLCVPPLIDASACG